LITGDLLVYFVPAGEERKEFYKKYRDFIVEENDKFIYLDPKFKLRIKYINLT
jgi:DNA ligase 1